MILVGYNPSTDNLEKSFLSNDYSAGVTSIVVRNADRFAADNRILIGEMGSENAEILTLNAVASDKQSLTLATGTLFPHNASDPVYILNYDEIKFYRSTTTVDGTYDEIATVAVDVDNADNLTRYDDTTGLSAYFYKISLHHSITLVESSLSDPMPGEGYSRKQVGTIVSDFLTEVGDLQQDYMTVPQIISLMNEVNDDIMGQSRRPYKFLSTKVLATLTANSDRIALPDDLLKFDRLRYARVDSTVTTNKTIPMISIEEMEYHNYSTDLNPAPVLGDVHAASIDYTTDELVVRPIPRTTQTDKLTIYYWKEMDTITSLANTVETPSPRIYKLFLLGRYYRIRSKKESSFLALSDRYINDYNTEIVKLQRFQKVDVGTPESMGRDTRTSIGVRR